MEQNELLKLNDTKAKTGDYLVYFEYHEGKEQFRAIHSKLAPISGYWWRSISGEKEMEDEVKTYKARGYEPLFVVLEGNYYQMLFVKPNQVAAAQKVLKELGIEPPEVK